MTTTQRVDIEKEFPVAIRAAGGEVVSDLLPTKTPPFENADYLFRGVGVVAELKCLDNDTVGDAGFLTKLSSLYRELMQQGRAPLVTGRGRVSLEQIAKIDERAALEFLEPYKQRLARVVKKANKQIEETSSYFGIQNPKGLLLLANDGEKSFEFDLILHLLGRLFKNCYRSINTVLYFTVNLSARVPGFHPAASLWAPLEVADRPRVDERLIANLTHAWMNHISTLTGGPVLTKRVASDDEIDVAQVRNTHGVRPKLDLRGAPD